MKRFKVVCIGYKEPSKEKIKDLLKFEENYLGNKRKVWERRYWFWGRLKANKRNLLCGNGGWCEWLDYFYQ